MPILYLSPTESWAINNKHFVAIPNGCSLSAVPFAETIDNHASGWPMLACLHVDAPIFF
jgi:hypothetical protein